MKANSWTVFFMLKPYTTLHTTVLTSSVNIDENIIIKLAKEKIEEEIGLDVFELAEKLGKNENFGTGWIAVEDNQEATEKEIEAIGTIHLS
ncbi:hypothetical protein SECTIM467_155 [Brevibacillus phage SecTim467]|uniref:Uncharacterized protein n=2 Tax=Jenstvirus jenst TaxID=1982225 RepID=A0A0K2CPC4_9CAUD|nr:hypothetical protein AVV11_gp041 [Brevibacillus phage Jenst]ALA07279.1 hypothetical protein JENST_150 [Brevibacillus phage Jenst]ALA07583.1 hypothetical protein SECTIM467_155 [Brevibacillus phage SecTim467]